MSSTTRDDSIGSPDHLRASVARAAAATDRAVGVWLARSSSARLLADTVGPNGGDRGSEDIRTLRALVRASATAYARRLKADGLPPERMLVLVKTAAGHPGEPGFGARELTSDVVRWSIDAYFNS
jgi:hypothetical protein